MNKRRNGSFLLACAIAVVGCIGIGLSVVSLAADGGYHPERHLDGVDPVRAGMVVLFLAGAVHFAFFLAGSVVGWRTQPGLGSISGVLAAGGMAIACAALALLLVSMPPTAGPIAMPPAIAAAVRIGGGLAIVGFVLGIVANAWDRIQGHS